MKEQIPYLPQLTRFGWSRVGGACPSQKAIELSHYSRRTLKATIKAWALPLCGISTLISKQCQFCTRISDSEAELTRFGWSRVGEYVQVRKP